MKRLLFIFALCLWSVAGSTYAQWSIAGTEIVLTEIVVFGPLDDNKEETEGGRPDPRQIRATQVGNTITASADTDALAHVTVRDQTTGSTVADQDFLGVTTIHVPAEGSYTIRIYSAGTAVEGLFSVK
mgnify:CR=1 FL=1